MKPVKKRPMTKTEKDLQTLTLTESYLKTTPEKVMPSTTMMPWDKKPFFSDGWIFNDSDPDMIIEDHFDSIDAKLKDTKYNWRIRMNLERAIPTMHSPDLGQAGTIDAKFRDNQLSRQILEDCQYSNGQIRIPQLTAPGACSIPSHLRIEQIAKFIGITLPQAKILAKIYRILDLDFNSVARVKIGSGKIKRTLNNHIRMFVKTTGRAPWEIRVTKDGTTLLKLAQEIKKLMVEDQEDPAWAKEDHFTPGNEGACYMRYSQEDTEDYYDWYMNRDEAQPEEERALWLSMAGEHYSVIRDPNENKEAQFEQSNPVGEYTYWNTSTIPVPDHLKGRRAKQFAKLISKMQNFELSDQQIIKAGKWVQKRCTPSQKAKWAELVHYVTGIRALGQMINTMVEQQDVRDQATGRVA